MVVWRNQEGTVEVNEQYVTMTMNSEIHRVCVDDFMKGELFESVVRSFSLLTAVEICTVISEDLYNFLPETVIYNDHRYAVSHCFGGGRGADWTVWFFGKTVRVSARDCVKIPDMTFLEYLQSGFPADIQKVIGDENIQRITSTIRVLEPLSCMCATGLERPHEHGTLRHIMYKQHPFAPIDSSITVGQCTVCGQRWSFQEAGDPHYSYQYSVTPFPSKGMCLSS